MDLGATEWTTFRKVTLPMIAPGVAAAGAAGRRDLGRRLRDHELQRRPDDHVPAVHLRRHAPGRAAAGQRARHRAAADRARADGAQRDAPAPPRAARRGAAAGADRSNSARPRRYQPGCVAAWHRRLDRSPARGRGRRPCPCSSSLLGRADARRPHARGPLLARRARRGHRRRRRRRPHRSPASAPATAARSCSAPRSRPRRRCWPSTASPRPASRRHERRDRPGRRRVAAGRRRRCSRSPRCPACATRAGSRRCSCSRPCSRSASSRSAPLALAFPSLVPSVPQAGSPPAIALLVFGLACLAVLAHRAMRTHALTHRPADLLVVAGCAWLGVSLYAQLAIGPGNVALLRRPRARARRHRADRHPDRARPRARRRLAPARRRPHGDRARRRRGGLPRHRACAPCSSGSPSATPRPRSTPAASRCSPPASARSSSCRPRCAATSPSAGCCTTSASSSVPLEILQKPGPLDDEEFAEIRRHPDAGPPAARGARRVPGAVRRLVSDHHERLDGTGYPRGLQGCDLSHRDPHPRRLRRLRRARLRPRVPRGVDARARARAAARGVRHRLRPEVVEALERVVTPGADSPSWVAGLAAPASAAPAARRSAAPEPPPRRARTPACMRRLTALLFVAAVLVAGCGSDDDRAARLRYADASAESDRGSWLLRSTHGPAAPGHHGRRYPFQSAFTGGSTLPA